MESMQNSESSHACYQALKTATRVIKNNIKKKTENHVKRVQCILKRF